jgi:mannose-6-phosphate isomerase-like protein (cupin superfamily)
MLQGKVWGKTEQLLITPMIEVHRVHIDPHSYCSMHKHEFKWNMFYVISGELEIHVRKNDYKLTDITTLHAGDWCSVRPNEFHMFKTNDSPVEALEVYYLEPIKDDIVRESVGGHV